MTTEEEARLAALEQEKKELLRALHASSCRCEIMQLKAEVAVVTAEARRSTLEQEKEFQRARADKWVAVVERRGAAIESLTEQLEAAEARVAALEQEKE